MIWITNRNHPRSPLLSGFRPMAHRSRFLGQNPNNRLIDLPLSAILMRGLVAIPPETFIWQNRLDPIGPMAVRLIGGQANYDALKAISQNPTQEEISDLSVIDAFFPGRDFYGNRATVNTQASGVQTFLELLCSGDISEQREQGGPTPIRWTEPALYAVAAASENPFYCPPELEIEMPFSWRNSIPYGLFLISDVDPWGIVRNSVYNAIVFMEVLSDYPFPSPISQIPGGWIYYQTPGVDVANGIRSLIKGDYLLDPEFVRFWITISVFATYPAVSAGVISELESDARRKKRMDLLKNLALAATFAVITAGIALALTPLLPAAGSFTGANVAKISTGAIQQLFSMEQRKEAAQNLEKAAKQFEATDAAFAEELRKAAAVFDFLQAEAERSRELSQEEKDALPESGIGLPLIGGVVVVGVGALILALS